MNGSGRCQNTINPNGDPFTVNLILPEGARGWIIEKLALRLVEHLATFGIAADIKNQPSDEADINHYMLYHHCQGPKLGITTLSITHVDDFRKLQLLRNNLKFADVGVCMSSDTVRELVRWGIRREQLCYINPGHDGGIRPRRIVIGITTRIYDDNRKREDLLVDLAANLSLDLFHFDIFGDGWERIIPFLEKAGATVSYYPGTGDYQVDYQLIRKHVSQFDYYLYMGLDEGSLGTLDALAAGVATIITPQGFHLDIPNGITYSFYDSRQLVQIFKSISNERRRRIDGVKQWTWHNFARQYVILWQSLLAGWRGNFDLILHGTSTVVRDSPYKRPFLSALTTRWKFYSRPFIHRLKRILGRRS